MHVVALIEVDRDSWADQIKSAIEAAVKRTAGGSATVQFTGDVTDADLILCLGSAALAGDVDARSRLTQALRKGIRILPIVSALPQFKSEVPSELHPINGIAWGNVAEIAEEVLRHLGLTERDRRVFLSYLRRETTPLAYQLYDELHRRNFSVFLDSFEIEHGELVQNRIEQALQHASFVLLLYSPSVETSEWIEKEINFALAQGLGLVALALPGAEKRPPFKLTPGDRRIQLQEGDLNGDCLTPTALASVLLEIDKEHADQFRERRESLIGDIAEALGGAAIRVGTQSLLYKNTFLRLTPRPPEARDAYVLDADCPIAEVEPKPQDRVLVGVKGGYVENRELTDWICGNLKHRIRWREPQAVCADPTVLEK